MDSLVYLAGLGFCLTVLWFVVGRIRAQRGNDWSIVTAQVVGHVCAVDNVESGDGSVSREEEVFAASYRFVYEGKEFQVTDNVAREKPTPPVGSLVELCFPRGQPERAQPPRRLLLMVLAVVLVVFSILLSMAAIG